MVRKMDATVRELDVLTWRLGTNRPLPRQQQFNTPTVLLSTKTQLMPVEEVQPLTSIPNLALIVDTVAVLDPDHKALLNTTSVTLQTLSTPPVLTPIDDATAYLGSGLESEIVTQTLPQLESVHNEVTVDLDNAANLPASAIDEEQKDDVPFTEDNFEMSNNFATFTQLNEGVNQDNFEHHADKLWSEAKVECEELAYKKAKLQHEKWKREKKSLEACIRESLGEYSEFFEKAEAIRLQFEHEKEVWKRTLYFYVQDKCSSNQQQNNQGYFHNAADNSNDNSNNFYPPAPYNMGFQYEVDDDMKAAEDDDRNEDGNSSRKRKLNEDITTAIVGSTASSSGRKLRKFSVPLAPATTAAPSTASANTK